MIVAPLITVKIFALLYDLFQRVNYDYNPKLYRTLTGLLSSEMVRPVMDHMFQIDYIFPQRPAFPCAKSQFVPLERTKPNFQLKLSFFNGLFSYCSECPYPSSLEELLIVTSSYLNGLLEARPGMERYPLALLLWLQHFSFIFMRSVLAPFHREGSPEEPDS